MIKAGLPALAVIMLLCCAPGAHAALTPELQKTIRSATFEVVMKKPEKDPLAYEKPLPLDLIPYAQRTDAYESVGTAFALGNNRYVTAGHVIGLGIASQWGPPELRRADGKVFAIDRILKYSAHEDFVVFSLKHDPQPAGLSVNRNPAVDDPVLAVGNALGEGVVIRDGLMTSLTPEDQDGRWKWIRFSAAASPGNSGGPLCDAAGRVIGVVIGKSPNENLNYALPIARVLVADGAKARFDLRVLTRLPFLHGTTMYVYKDEFDLPLSWPDFAARLQKTGERHADEARAQLLRTYAETIFPKGAGADDLIFDAGTGTRPRLLTQRDDGTWVGSEPKYEEVSLGADGSVAVATAAGVGLIRLIRPDRASDDAFYGNSQAFMDLALKALSFPRLVGRDPVRITSFGRAVQESIYTDTYGRRWQQRVWAIPFMNAYLVGMLLPTPDGYDAVVTATPSPGLHETIETLRLMTGLVSVSYTGTLAQWQAALQRRDLLPKALEEVRLDRSPAWTLRTPRFVSSVPTGLLPLSETSPLSLVMGFTKTASGTTWDIDQIWWEKDTHHDSGLIVWRQARPPEDTALALRNKFDGIRAHRAPFDGSTERNSETTYSYTTVIDVPGAAPDSVSADLEYGVTVRANGVASLAQSKDYNVAGTVQILEHGSGIDVPARPTAAIEPDFTSEQEALTRASAMSVWLGRDVRGRLATDDLRDLIESMKGRIGKTSGEERRRLIKEGRQELEWLGAYWDEYPALMHNRDLWSSFLERNRWPAGTPHQPDVVSAEAALKQALKGPISDEWAKRAHQLRQAYVDERNYLVRHPPSTPREDPQWIGRKTACPPPAASTSGGSWPKVGTASRSLQELWPVESRRLGEEGTVLARIRVTASGCVSEMMITGSSGSYMMDNAVQYYLESMTFVPAGVDGKAIQSVATLPVVFKLDPVPPHPPFWPK